MEREKLLPLLDAIGHELRARELRWRLPLNAGRKTAVKDEHLRRHVSVEAARGQLVSLAMDFVPRLREARTIASERFFRETNVAVDPKDRTIDARLPDDVRRQLLEPGSHRFDECLCGLEIVGLVVGAMGDKVRVWVPK